MRTYTFRTHIVLCTSARAIDSLIKIDYNNILCTRAPKMPRWTTRKCIQLYRKMRVK